MKHHRENIYFQLYNQREGDFPVFQGGRYIQYGNGFWEVFFIMCSLWLLNGQRHFWGALCRKGKKGKLGEIQQNNQFSLLLARFSMKQRTGWSKREVGKGKGKKNWGVRQYIMQHHDPGRESIRIAKQILIFTWKTNVKNQSNIIFKWMAFWVIWIILSQMLCNSVYWVIMTEYLELDKH